MHYIIYETTNLVNGKKYRGAHHAENLNDKYLGSGIAIARAIKKYGCENFKREILEECESPEAMYEAEAKWVTQEWVDKNDTYNLRSGGLGGFITSDETRKRLSESKIGTIFSDDHCEKLSIAAKRRPPNIKKGHKFGPMSDERKAKQSLSMLGKNTYKRSPETCKKMSQSRMGKAPWNKGKKMEFIPKSESHKENISKALTFDLDIDDIRNRKDRGESLKTIAEAYNVSIRTIQRRLLPNIV